MGVCSIGYEIVKSSFSNLSLLFFFKDIHKQNSLVPINYCYLTNNTYLATNLGGVQVGKHVSIPCGVNLGNMEVMDWDNLKTHSAICLGVRMDLYVAWPGQHQKYYGGQL